MAVCVRAQPSVQTGTSASITPADTAASSPLVMDAAPVMLEQPALRL